MFLALCGVVLSFVNDEKLRHCIQLSYFPLVLFVLAAFVGMRSSDRDYDGYAEWFGWISAGHLLAQDWMKDPAFVLVSYVVSVFGLSFVGVTIFFAVATLASQFCFSKLASDERWITLFFYLVVCRTLLGSDMTAIRAAVAIPLMSISFLLAFRGKKKIALLLYAVALTFHLSVLIGLLPFVLVMFKVQFHSRWWVLSWIPGGIFAKIELQNVIGLLSNNSRAGVYVDSLNASQGPPSAYYIYIGARLLILALIVIVYWNKITAESRLALFCFSIGIFLQILFISNNALSWRSSDIFAMFDVVVLMLPLKLMKGYYRLLYAGGLVVFGMASFQYSIKIMEPYQWIFS
jgi:hypothetical protein